MRKFIGRLLVAVGIASVLCAIGLAVFNRVKAENALESSKSLLEDVQKAIEAENKQNEAFSEHIMPDQQSEMSSIKVNGNDCIGILSIPVLELELPVLSDWSYEKLKTAPCLYYGSCYEKNFVIAAHNYRGHFGRLSELQAGDLIVFTDVKGIKHRYEVILLETLSGNATEEMIAGGFDLSLYTCTLGGESRVTVRCNLIKAS